MTSLIDGADGVTLLSYAYKLCPVSFHNSTIGATQLTADARGNLLGVPDRWSTFGVSPRSSGGCGVRWAAFR